LITGCDGHISKYVKELFGLKYDLYGIAHLNKKYEKGILKYYFDISDKSKLEFFLDTIKPDIIIHLAGISNSADAYQNPIKTLEINGLVTAYLCDIIHKKQMKTILFNSSSSEMYKGHNIYKVDENDTHKYHLHPYSIAKIMGHNMVDFYRETYDLPFSNGIFFTIESKDKNNSFLLNKVSCHAKKWNKTKEVLVLGNLSSYRNILHAYDAANAIEKIIKSNKFGNYLICNTETHKVIDLVKYIYSLCEIELYENIIDDKTYYYENKTHLPVIELTSEQKGYDTTITNIDGSPTKLLEMGWTPTIYIHDILCEILINK
jgi:GDP-mannose 4,6-dehydratase